MALLVLLMLLVLVDVSGRFIGDVGSCRLNHGPQRPTRTDFLVGVDLKPVVAGEHLLLRGGMLARKTALLDGDIAIWVHSVHRALPKILGGTAPAVSDESLHVGCLEDEPRTIRVVGVLDAHSGFCSIYMSAAIFTNNRQQQRTIPDHIRGQHPQRIAALQGALDHSCVAEEDAPKCMDGEIVGAKPRLHPAADSVNKGTLVGATSADVMRTNAHFQLHPRPA